MVPVVCEWVSVVVKAENMSGSVIVSGADDAATRRII